MVKMSQKANDQRQQVQEPVRPLARKKSPSKTKSKVTRRSSTDKFSVIPMKKSSERRSSPVISKEGRHVMLVICYVANDTTHV